MFPKSTLDRALWALVALLPLALAWWRAPFLGDPVIDFGHELYVAWRLAEGEALYRDLGYYFGPVSPWLNALLFRLFGAARETLLVANLAVWLATLACLGLLLKPYFRPRAIAFALLFASLLAFNHLRIVPNYNVLTPYRHGLTHGFLFALIALLFLRKQKPGNWLFAGIAAGLAGLAKIEVAAALALAVWPLLLFRGRRCAVSFFTGVSVPWLTALLALTIGYGFSFSEAASHLTSAFTLAGNAEVRRLSIYSAALEHLGPSELLGILGALLGIAVFLFSLAASLKRAGKKRAFIVPVILSVSVLLLVLFVPFAEKTLLAFRAVPWVAFGAVLFFLRQYLRAKTLEHASHLALSLFAFFLTLKVAARLSVAETGFLLGLPAALALLLLALEAAPKWLKLDTRLLPAWRLSVLAGFLLPLLSAQRITEETHERQSEVLSLPKGEIRYPPLTAGAFSELFDFTAKLAQEGATITFLPEGTGFNFYLGARNPAWPKSFLPDHYLQYGPEAMKSALARGAPELIVLLPRSTAEFGEEYGEFRSKYGLSTYLWIRGHYEPAPGMPPSLTSLGIEVWRRRGAGDRNSP